MRFADIVDCFQVIANTACRRHAFQDAHQIHAPPPMLTPRYAIIALAILFPLIGASWGQTQQLSPSGGNASGSQQTQATANQQQPPTDTRGTEQNPVIIRSIRSKQETAADAADRDARASTDRWMLIAAIATVVGVFVQALIFIVILRTSRQQLRAYIFAEVDEKDRPFFDFNSGIRITLRGRNRGLTPAYRVTQIIRCEVLPFPLTGAPPLPEAQESEGVLSLGPRADFLLIGQLPRPFTTEEREGLIIDAMRVYVYGEIRYRDAFALWRGWRRERQNRFARFRYMIPVDHNGHPDGIMACGEGNHSN